MAENNTPDKATKAASKNNLPTVMASVGLSTSKAVYTGRSGSRSTVIAECKVELDGLLVMPVTVWGRLSAENGRPSVAMDLSIPGGRNAPSLTDALHAEVVKAVSAELTRWPYLVTQQKQALSRLIEAEKAAPKAETTAPGRRSNAVGAYTDDGPQLVK